MSNLVDKANEEIGNGEESNLSFEEYLELVEENPQYAARSSQYVLNAIKYYGKRTVVEEGEEKERWCFFDDPENGNRNAVLGNTDMLNEFVDQLELVASGNAGREKITWFVGPTATGKSELKRCLVNGIREYSKTEEGKRFTVEWNVGSRSERDGMSYGGGTQSDMGDWYLSPVQGNPLTILPDRTYREFVEGLGEHIKMDAELDPFSRESYDILKRHYERSGAAPVFTRVVDPSHLRVCRYTVDVGSGIGILHSEDDGKPKEKLVGHWIPSLVEEFGRRGSKSPHAFSYDGVLSQGNTCLSIIEDAAQHADVLQTMLNIPEEGMVKLDRRVTMDIDTLLIMISNPDLDEQLRSQQHEGNRDPLKALRRRMSRHSFKYLTSISSEVELLRREILNEFGVWTQEETRSRSDPVIANGSEIAPHTLEAAALYTILTRIRDSNKPQGLDLADKAEIFDRGYIYDNNTRIEYDELDWDEHNSDGEYGIPVTYTRDVIAQLTTEHDVIMPDVVLEELVTRLGDDPVFSHTEVTDHKACVIDAGEHIWDMIEDDVLSAALRDKIVDEEMIEEYVDMVYAWDEGDEDEYDPLEMKVFEKEHLSRFKDGHYRDGGPSESVKRFRENDVIESVGVEVYKNRGRENINLKDLPVFDSVLTSHSWSDISRKFENFDPDQWDNPPEGTETEKVKEMTIQNMIEMFNYTEESAKQASSKILNEVTV